MDLMMQIAIYAGIALALAMIAGRIAALTPSPRDDTIAAKVLQFLQIFDAYGKMTK